MLSLITVYHEMKSPRSMIVKLKIVNDISIASFAKQLFTRYGMLL